MNLASSLSVIAMAMFVICPFNSHPFVRKSPMFLLRSCITEQSDSGNNRIGPWGPVLIQDGGLGVSTRSEVLTRHDAPKAAPVGL